MQSYIELCKVKISFFAAFSSATGYILATSVMDHDVITLTFGVFLFACGLGSLNQFQERDLDKQMFRTNGRPVPAGRIRPSHALLYSLFLIICGTCTIYSAAGFPAMLLGLFAIIWYNGVYTYLKRISAFAAVIGAIVGTIPPAMGWVAGGKSLLEPQILVLGFIFFIWQVPHFWLLTASFEEDYRSTVLPAVTKVFSRGQLSRITAIWIFASGISCLLLPLFHSPFSALELLLIVFISVLSIWNGMNLLRKGEDELTHRLSFKRINICMFLLLTVLSGGRLLYQYLPT